MEVKKVQRLNIIEIWAPYAAVEWVVKVWGNAGNAVFPLQLEGIRIVGAIRMERI